MPYLQKDRVVHGRKSKQERNRTHSNGLAANGDGVTQEPVGASAWSGSAVKAMPGSLGVSRICKRDANRNSPPKRQSSH